MNILDYAIAKKLFGGSGSGGGDAQASLNALINRSITEIESDAGIIGANAFANCTALITANFPKATSVGNTAFQSCMKLTTVNFPNVTDIGSSGFNSCTALITANFPNAISVAENAFRSCYKLTSANFPNATIINYSSFENCYPLTKVIIGTNLTTVATLANTNAFNKCYHILGTTNSTYNPTGAKDGYIYVPDNLVSSYKSATNWSTYASQIKGISELPTEE